MIKDGFEELTKPACVRLALRRILPLDPINLKSIANATSAVSGRAALI
jgi:hypothetical protein